MAANSGGDRGAMVLWRRIREHGDKLAVDRRLATQIGLLSLDGLLTDTQVSAAHLIAEIYGEYERFHGKRRAAASPSYEFGFGSEWAEPTDRDARKRWRRAYRRADKRYTQLQCCIPLTPSALGEALEHLCVDDRPVPRSWLPEIRIILDRVAEWIRRGSEVPALERHRGAPAKPKPQRPATQAPKATFATNTERQDWLTVTRRLRPDLTDEQLEQAWKVYAALRAPRERAIEVKRGPVRAWLADGAKPIRMEITDPEGDE